MNKPTSFSIVRADNARADNVRADSPLEKDRAGSEANRQFKSPNGVPDGLPEEQICGLPQSSSEDAAAQAPARRRLAVIALGGNAVLRKGQAATADQEIANLERVTTDIARLASSYDLVVTHGNGPQVGNILARFEECARLVPPLPLDVAVAHSLGELGYLIQQTLGNEIRARGLAREVVTVLTQVVVDPDDPGFAYPSKPIGPRVTREEAESLRQTRGWVMGEVSDHTYRRLVPSPRPLRIVESALVRSLVRSEAIVIAVGGGGIPVVETADGRLRGVEAVIDKDLASGLLAREIGADYLVILTDVERAALNYGTPEQTELAGLDLASARSYLAQGHFPEGSMGPKIKAAVEFLEEGGEVAIVTSTEKLLEALRGQTGTRLATHR